MIWTDIVHVNVLVPLISLHPATTGLFSPIRHQAIIWTNAGLLPIGHMGTKFSEILVTIKKIFIHQNESKKKFVCKMAAILSRER